MVNGGPWSNFSKCSGQHIFGLKTRERVCNKPNPNHEGQCCDGAPTDVQICPMAIADYGIPFVSFSYTLSSSWII